MKKKTVKEPSLAQQALINQINKNVQAVDKLEGEAAAIWNEIKDKNIDMFALPDQKIHMHCRPTPVEPSKLYLLTTSSAVLPSLEVAVGKGFTVELNDKYTIVARAVKK